MTDLTPDNMRRLDALNLIQAVIDQDAAKMTEISALYEDREDAEALISSLAMAGGLLANLPGGRDLLAKRRKYLLGDLGENR